jgi:hypothetical protein
MYIYAWSVFFLTTQQSFLLDILDNLPRIRLSSSQLKLILWPLKELGVQDVPSYDRFRTMQTEVRRLCTSEPISLKSHLGNSFSVNDPRESVALV